MSRTRFSVTVFLSVVIGSAVVVGLLNPEMLRARAMSRESFLEVFEPLFLASLLIERVIEVFISVWRDAGATNLELAKQAGSANAATKLAEYRDETRTWTLISGVVVGFVVSAVGLRSLGPWLDFESARSPAQTSAFTILDVLLTGFLIGGGSDFLHRLITVFTNFLDSSAQRGKAPTLPTGGGGASGVGAGGETGAVGPGRSATTRRQLLSESFPGGLGDGPMATKIITASNGAHNQLVSALAKPGRTTLLVVASQAVGTPIVELADVAAQRNPSRQVVWVEPAVLTPDETTKYTKDGTAVACVVDPSGAVSGWLKQDEVDAGSIEEDFEDAGA